MLSKIFLADSVPQTQFSTSEDSAIIENLSNLNIFIGKNNSGKSRLIRALFSNNLRYYSFEDKIHSYNKIIQEFNQDIHQLFHHFNLIQINEKDLSANQIPELYYLAERDIQFSNEVEKHIKSFDSRSDRLTANSASPMFGAQQKHDSASTITSLYDKLQKSITGLDYNQNNYTFDKIYIPILRGLRPFSNVDEYEKRTREDYFDKIYEDEKNIERLKIYTGLTLFEDLKQLLLGSRKDRERVRKFEEFLSKNFFDGNEVNIVPKHEEDVVYVLIGDDHERERPIYELGDGIQSIIILTYPLFFNHDSEKLQLVFLEEPEQCLHPGLQRLLIKTLLDFPNFQYFITTHSNHFLELMQDFENITLYTVDQDNNKNENKITNVYSQDNNVLELIGVNNASVFLANCTIWVEGITDRLYIRKFLEIYFKKHDKTWKEDYHYSFVEYGGSNIVHWDFSTNEDEKGDDQEGIKALKISNNILLIADRDCDKNGKIPKNKEGRFKKLQSIMDDRFILLESKEIENLLSVEVIESTISKKEDQTISKFTKTKINNDYKYWNLGEWITKKYIGLNRKYVDGNTIYDKTNFAKIAVSNIENYEHLSAQAIELCKKIERFIESKNKY